ncbi:MAG: hypothetical protein R3F07_02465 [Opitutaceae bacterium]
MDEWARWIERYNAGGGPEAEGFVRPQWPEILLTTENLERLIEGVLAERVDWPGLVFDGEPPPDEVLEAIEMMIRVPDLQVRYRPEGCSLRSKVEILLRLESPEEEDEAFEELIRVESEICLSFTERFGVSPVIDVMGGEVVLVSTGARTELAPATEILDPEWAVEWGLNGCDPDLMD